MCMRQLSAMCRSEPFLKPPPVNPAPESETGMIDWIRVDELRDEVGEDDFAEVLEMFFDEAASVLGTLGAGDTEATMRDLHSLKGCALNIGLADVSDLCRNYESTLMAKPDAAINVDAIRDAFLASKEIMENRSG